MPNETGVQALLNLVHMGFYVHNLRRMEAKSEELLNAGEQPVVFFCLQSMFFELRMSWQDYPLALAESRQVQERLVAPIAGLLTMLLKSEPREAITEQLAQVIAEFVKVRAAIRGKAAPAA